MKISEIESKVDKIIVSESEFKKITKYYQDNPAMVLEPIDKRMFFPLKTFIIDLHLDKRTTIKALVELDTFHPAQSGRITTDRYWFTFKREPLMKRTRFDGNGAPENIVSTVHGFIVGVLMYICLQSRERIIKEREERKENKTKVAKPAINPYEFRERECFLLNQIIEYVKDHPTRKSIQYQCECWGVRGHIRHKANGNIEFVHPYKKGRKRDVLEPKSKTYLLGGELADATGAD